MEILPYRVQLLLYLVQTRGDFQGAKIVKTVSLLRPSITPVLLSLPDGYFSCLGEGVTVFSRDTGDWA